MSLWEKFRVETLYFGHLDEKDKAGSGITY